VRYGLALVGLLIAATALARPGKVVRVERRARVPEGTPRMCTLSGSDLTGYCITSKAPEVGNRLTILDGVHTLGIMRLTAVTEPPEMCGQHTVWMIQGSLETGDLAKPEGGMIGVLDVPLDPRAGKLVQVDHPATGHAFGTDQVWAVDGNGDGAVDVEFAMFACDDGGAAGPNPTGTCVEVWQQNATGRLEKTRQDRFRNCF
jgi:hypothetical protein